MKPRVLIVGSSGHAQVVADVVERAGEYEILGWIDSFRKAGERSGRYAVLGDEYSIPGLMAEHAGLMAIVAVGHNWRRGQVVKRLREIAPELRFATAIHPFSAVSPYVEIGAGTVVMPGAVVNAGSTIGEFCILNTNSSLDHDSVLSDYASLAPGVVTGGKAHVGAFAAICIGAKLRHQVKVGEHTVVGAGATVLQDLPGSVVAYGIPAKVIRQRVEGDEYL